MGAVERILKLVNLKVETVNSSCCGMAGAFGYGADTIDVSLAMGELSLLPAVRKADADTLIVADGTSCRHQIHDGTQREALHVARVLAIQVSGHADCRELEYPLPLRERVAAEGRRGEGSLMESASPSTSKNAPTIRKSNASYPD